MKKSGRTISAAETHANILETATRLFAHNCYDETSMSDIGGELGISGAALYYHFASKPKLLFYCLERILQRKIALAEAIIRDADKKRRTSATDTLHNFVHRTIIHAFEEPVVSMWFDIIQGVGRVGKYLEADEWSYLQGLEARHQNILMRIIKQGVDTGEFNPPAARTVACSILAMCNQATRWQSPQNAKEVEALADEHAAIALQMASASFESPHSIPKMVG